MKAYLIPGNRETLESRNYGLILKLYEKHGYEPHFVPIRWKYRTIDDWINQVTTQIPASDIRSSLLSGFSFGSMIALGVAVKNNPKSLLLFSLSPYFKEDFPLPEKNQEWAGKRRVKNFSDFSFNEMARQISCPTTIFVGEKEKKKYKNTWTRNSQAHKKIIGSKLIVVKGVGHDVADSLYVKSIEQSLLLRV